MNGVANSLLFVGSTIARPALKCAFRCVALLACMFQGSDGFAANQVYVLLSSDAPYYQQVADVFTQQLKAQQPNIDVQSFTVSDDNALPLTLGQHIVAIGSAATAQARANYPRSGILSLMIPMAAWQDFNKDAAINDRFAAVVIDQPFERAVLLGQLLKPDTRRFGAIFGPASQVTKQASLERVSGLDVKLITANLPPTDNPISVLSPIINASEVFIAVPDRAAFNRNIAKWILHLSYREKIPAIGFSASYTKAGALASIYSSPTNIGHHGAELFAKLTADKSDNTDKNWHVYYPKYYTLSTNEEVARVLNIDLPPLEDLYRMYQKLLQTM